MSKLIKLARRLPIPPRVKKIVRKLRRNEVEDPHPDPLRLWDGQDLQSPPWNTPLFNQARLNSLTATFNHESRDTVRIDRAVDLLIESAEPAICRVGFAARSSAGIAGSVNGHRVLELQKLPPDRWYDVRLELEKGAARLRLEVTEGGPVFMSHPIVRPKENDASKPRNVIVIILDSVTRDLLDEYLGQVGPRSPLGTFFANAYVYDNAFSQGEWTLPSIYSLVTGKSTFAHGAFERYLAQGLAPDVAGTLAQVMTEKGYATFCYSTTHIFQPAFGAHLGFQRFVYQPYLRGLSHVAVTEQAVSHLESHCEFHNFLLLDYFDTHPPYIFNSQITDVAQSAFRIADPAAEWKTFISGVDARFGERIISEEGLRRLRQRALARLREVDISLGWLFGYLEQSGAAQESLVILLGDHGSKFGGNHQPLLCDNRTHVALLLRVPGQRGTHVLALVNACTDVLPTIAHLVGAGTTERQGRVLPPFGPEREFIISESAYEGVYQAAVRTREFVLHARSKYDPHTKKVNNRNGLGKYLFLRQEETACKDVQERYPEMAERLYQALLEHLDGHREV